jgi:hypothetical protein
MTQITLQDGKLVLRDGKVGTGEACCCDQADLPLCSCGWFAFADGFPIDPDTCQCPEILGGGITDSEGGACSPCPTTPFGPFRCLAEAQAFGANYPEAQWSEGFAGDECLELLDENFCLPESFASDSGCRFFQPNPLP